MPKLKENVPRTTLEQQQIKAIGRAFRIARLDLGLQLQQVSEASGVSRLTIGKIEKGSLANVSLEILNRIATALDMKISLVVEQKSKPKN